MQIETNLVMKTLLNLTQTKLILLKLNLSLHSYNNYLPQYKCGKMVADIGIGVKCHTCPYFQEINIFYVPTLLNQYYSQIAQYSIVFLAAPRQLGFI